MQHFFNRFNAALSYYFHIPFPEKLEDDEWFEKVRQLQWIRGTINAQQDGSDSN